MNITLIGMAGAGKSYIGKRIAERLGLLFFDNDTALAEKHGKGIQELLDSVGEEKYLEEEARTLVERTAGMDDLLIAPGGSIIYREDAMDHLKDISYLIYLQVPYETIEMHLRGLPPRAIIGLDRRTLRELYDERHPLYRLHADHSLDVAGRTPDEVMTMIGRRLRLALGPVEA